MPLIPRKNDTLIGRDLNNFCQYHKTKYYKTNDSKILKRDIEYHIKMGLLKNMVSIEEQRSSSPLRPKSLQVDHAQPYSSQQKRGTINVIFARIDDKRRKK